MQTVAAQRSSFAGAAVRSAARVQQSRCTVVVRASAEETRRGVLTGFVASTVAFSAALSAQAIEKIELIDDRKAIDKGFDIIYEARNLDLPQSQRDGLTQARTSLEATKKRVSESEKRIDTTIEPYVSKQYWTLAREELRNQVGTLRFDLNTLAEAKGSKDAKKQALALKNTFLAKTDALDYAIRQKDLSAATASLTAAQKSLDDVLAFLL